MHKKIVTLATACTLTRIILIPYILSALNARAWPLATVLFLLAAITDFLDGYFARSRNEQTTFGAALDPIADKLLILSAGALLLPTWLFWLLLVKETIIVLGAALILGLGMNLSGATPLSKWATTTQLLFITLLCLAHELPWLLPDELYAVFIVAICSMSLGALVQYGYLGIRNVLKIGI